MVLQLSVINEKISKSKIEIKHDISKSIDNHFELLNAKINTMYTSKTDSKSFISEELPKNRVRNPISEERKAKLKEYMKAYHKSKRLKKLKRELEKMSEPPPEA